MKETDSRECRNCHDFDSMRPEDQKGRARKQHYNGMQAGNTCIDCHKGIAHNKVHDQLTDEELDALEVPHPENKRPIPEQWLAYMEEGKKAEAEAEEPQEIDAGSEAQVAAATEPESATALESAVPATAESEVAAAAPADATPEAVAAAPVAAAAAVAAAPAAAGGPDIDWSSVEATEVVLFYPGQSSMEWVLNGRDHGGARPLKAGDRCLDCHEGEESAIGDLIVSGEKLEPNPISGKRGSIAVNVQAMHDGDNLYMRFQWEDTAHAPAPFVDGGKMDPDNQMKLAIMLTTDDETVEFAERSGCWQTCHHDARTMPDTPDSAALGSSPLAQSLNLADGVTKYLQESRTEIEIKGKEGKPRGGWDKLKGDAEIQAALSGGQFMDLLRYSSGSGASEDGYILEKRVMQGGQGVSFSGRLAGGVWTVEMQRKLASDQPGDVSMSTSEWYNIGFAIHDDYSSSRYHHVSQGYKLGFDDEDAEINAVGK